MARRVWHSWVSGRSAPWKENGVEEKSAKPDEALNLLLGWIRASHKLRALGQEMGAMTEGGRGAWGVLHSLVSEGPQTVPQLARARPVSRQHIQQIANELMAAGFIESLPNPAHRRSRLLAITASGRAEYLRVRDILLQHADTLFAGMDQSDVARSRQMLAIVLQRLDELLVDVPIMDR